MFCNQCGSPLAAQAVFCPQCGRAAGSPAASGPPVAALGRVAQHRNILGVLWLVLGILGLIGSAVLLGMASFRPWENPYSAPAPDFLVPLLSAIGTVLLVFSLLRVLAGVGLLQTQGWARLLVIVLAVVTLIEIPIGTLLGIYTLWALAPAASEAEYAQLVQARRH